MLEFFTPHVRHLTHSEHTKPRKSIHICECICGGFSSISCQNREVFRESTGIVIMSGERRFPLVTRLKWFLINNKNLKCITLTHQTDKTQIEENEL